MDVHSYGGKDGFALEERAEELIMKVKTCCNPMPPERADEIWRQFNSQDSVTKHTALWNAECALKKYFVQNGKI